MEIKFNHKLKVHYHSDCSFFAGCENMVANFLNSDQFHDDYTLSFSYRYTALYRQGLAYRVNKYINLYPLNFPDLSDLTNLPIPLPYGFKRILLAFFRSIFLMPLLVYEIFILYNLFKRLRPDILHINNGGYPGALSCRAAALAGWLANVPVIVMVVNNMAVGYRRITRWLDYPVDRLITAVVDVFVTGSNLAGIRLRRVLGVLNGQIIKIHNGIELRPRNETTIETRQRLGLDSNSGIIIGVVALLVERKGHSVLIDAIEALVKNNGLRKGQLTVLIEGQGPLYKNLVSYVSALGLEDYVSFVGDESNIMNFIAALDILVLPSIRDEDFPNVILEAMALSVPVIATRIAGIPEQVVNQETGLLVEPGSILELAGAIIKLTTDIELRQTMGRAGAKRFATYFTHTSALKHYSALYNLHNKYQR